MKLGKIYVEHAGSDIYAALKTSLLTAKREKCAIVQLYINLTDPHAPFAYEQAKALGYFCTGILPCTTIGDYLTMQCLVSDIVDYNTFQTIEPFTTLISKIQKLDPNEG